MRRWVWIFVLTVLSAAPLCAGVPTIIGIAPSADIAVISSQLQATIIDSIPELRIYLLDIPATAGASPLLWSGSIEWMEPNFVVSLPLFEMLGTIAPGSGTAADWYRDQPALRLVRASQARLYTTGRSIVIADINSAVDYSHPALVGHLTSGRDFVSEGAATDVTPDQSTAGFLDQSSAGFLDGAGVAHGHATLCAGIIAVVAPGSMIMPLRVFDDHGRAGVFGIAEAIHYAVKQGAHVINMSFGTAHSSIALKSAVDFAMQSQVSLVASAGNHNSGEPQFPAGYHGVLAAAATDLTDRKASFSNYGRAVFVTAPGVNVISAYPGNLYALVSGTSFSAPILAGAVNLLRAPNRLDAAAPLGQTAVDVDAQNPEYVHQLGHGRIDILAAVAQED